MLDFKSNAPGKTKPVLRQFVQRDEEARLRECASFQVLKLEANEATTLDVLNSFKDLTVTSQPEEMLRYVTARNRALWAITQNGKAMPLGLSWTLGARILPRAMSN